MDLEIENLTENERVGWFEQAENDIAEELCKIKKSFLIIGENLKLIRDGKFYLFTHKTFEAYCQYTWKYTRSYTNRLIGAVVVVNNLAPIGPIPNSESVIRPLTKVKDPEKQREIWHKANKKTEELGREVTAKDVSEIVEAQYSEVEEEQEPLTHLSSRKIEDKKKNLPAAIKNEEKINLYSDEWYLKKMDDVFTILEEVERVTEGEAHSDQNTKKRFDYRINTYPRNIIIIAKNISEYVEMIIKNCKG
jgi:hypothetical protein